MGVKTKLVLHFILGAISFSLVTSLFILGKNAAFPVPTKMLLFAVASLIGIATLFGFWWSSNKIAQNLRSLTKATTDLTRSPTNFAYVPHLKDSGEFQELEIALAKLAKSCQRLLGDHANKTEKTQKHLRKTFERISQAITSVLNLEELLTLILDITLTELELDQILLYLFDSETGQVSFKMGRGVDHEERFSDETCQKMVMDLARRKEVLSGKVKEVFPPFVSSDNGESVALSSPLIVKENVNGVVIGKREKGASSLYQKDLDLFATLTNQAAIAIQNAQFYEQTQQLAVTDGLTRMYNHRFFQEKLAEEIMRAERFQHSLSLLMIDIDHFKKYNDTYGHPRGDLVLREIAQILMKSVRDTDIIARYGGEEFAIILPETAKTAAFLGAERILKKVRSHKFPAQDEHSSTQLMVSIGVATFPREATTAEELIEKADKKLYQAKRGGRNRVC